MAWGGGTSSSISQEGNDNDDEDDDVLFYESSLWIQHVLSSDDDDASSTPNNTDSTPTPLDYLVELFNHLTPTKQQQQNLIVTHVVSIATAWDHYFPTNINRSTTTKQLKKTSPLLTTAWRLLQKDSYTSSSLALLSRVTLGVLMYTFHPLPLAIIVAHYGPKDIQEEGGRRMMEDVRRYALKIVTGERGIGIPRWWWGADESSSGDDKLTMQSSSQDVINELSSDWDKCRRRNDSGREIVAFIRRCFHRMRFGDSDDDASFNACGDFICYGLIESLGHHDKSISMATLRAIFNEYYNYDQSSTTKTTTAVNNNLSPFRVGLNLLLLSSPLIHPRTTSTTNETNNSIYQMIQLDHLTSQLTRYLEHLLNDSNHGNNVGPLVSLGLLCHVIPPSHAVRLAGVVLKQFSSLSSSRSSSAVETYGTMIDDSDDSRSIQQQKKDLMECLLWHLLRSSSIRRGEEEESLYDEGMGRYVHDALRVWMILGRDDDDDNNDCPSSLSTKVEKRIQRQCDLKRELIAIVIQCLDSTTMMGTARSGLIISLKKSHDFRDDVVRRCCRLSRNSDTSRRRRLALLHSLLRYDCATIGTTLLRCIVSSSDDNDTIVVAAADAEIIPSTEWSSGKYDDCLSMLIIEAERQHCTNELFAGGERDYRSMIVGAICARLACLIDIVMDTNEDHEDDVNKEVIIPSLINDDRRSLMALSHALQSLVRYDDKLFETTKTTTKIIDDAYDYLTKLLTSYFFKSLTMTKKKKKKKNRKRHDRDDDDECDATSSLLSLAIDLTKRRRRKQKRDGEGEGGHDDAVSGLSHVLFIYLCDMLPLSLRRWKKKQQRQVTTTTVTSSKKKSSSSSSPISILNLLIQCVQINDTTIFDNDNSLATQSPVFVAIQNTAILTSLKYGIDDNDDVDDDNDDDDDNEDKAKRHRRMVTSRCLYFVRVVVTSAAAAIRKAATSMVGFRPWHIHEMIVTHSKFASVMAMTTVMTDDGSNEEQQQYNDYDTKTNNNKISSSNNCPKLELIRLLLCCASLSSSKDLKVTRDLWDVVMVGFNAGLCGVDRSLRRLLYFYDRAGEGEEKTSTAITIHMDELRWGGSPIDSSSRQKKRDNINQIIKNWEWFLRSFDIKRVQATLKQFPTWEELIPPPVDDVEMWLTTTTKEVQGVEKVDEGGDYDTSVAEEVDDEMMDEEMTTARDDDDVDDGEGRTSSKNNDTTTTDSKLKKPKSQPRQTFDVWQGKGPDIRYNPAFILPLILSLLQSYHHHSPSSTTTLNTTKQLCHNGGLALTLASISCQSPTLRRIAIATLSLFQKSIDDPEAESIKSWNDRPQLSMLLRSLRQGLQQRNSTQVPLVPYISALFLSRSSLILSHPGDVMYPSINSYYLRLPLGGTYRDLKSLPAFSSFYAASSTEGDEGQEERRRSWCEELLRDGIVDGHCYKLAMARHAPEMMLTQQDSSFNEWGGRIKKGRRNSRREEWEAVTAMLRNGGALSRGHLLRRLGLLSYVRRLVEGMVMTIGTVGGQLQQERKGEMEGMMMSVAMRREFWELLTTCASVAMMGLKNTTMEERQRMMEGEELVEEVISLVGPIVDLFVNVVESTTGDDDDAMMTLSEMDAFCDVLCSFRSIIASMKKNPIIDNGCSFYAECCCYRGISLESALRLISNHHHHGHDKILPKVLDAIVAFPFQRTKDEQCVKKFCIKALSLIPQCLGFCRSFDVSAILRFVTSFCKVYPETLKNDEEIIALVLDNWSSCIRSSPKGKLVWLNCLKELVLDDAVVTTNIFGKTNDGSGSVDVAREILRTMIVE